MVRGSRDGSLSSLPIDPDRTVWDEVASDTGNCLGRACPTYKDCFYFRARRRASNAQLLIVNHAMLFSDLALRQQGVGHASRLRRRDFGRMPYDRSLSPAIIWAFDSPAASSIIFSIDFTTIALKRDCW